MNDLSTLVEKYLATLSGINDDFAKMGKKDWSKLLLLFKNFTPFSDKLLLLDDIERQIRDQAYSDIYTCDENYRNLLNAIIDRNPVSDKEDWSVKNMLEHWRDEWEWKMEEGHVDESNVVEKIDSLLSMTAFTPDDWLVRKSSISGVYLDKNINIPRKFISAFTECYNGFIFGNFNSCFAMARATTEVLIFEAVEKTNQKCYGMTLNDVIRAWDNYFPKSNEIKKMVDFIRKSANSSLHDSSEKVTALPNEATAHKCLVNLKKVVEFFTSNYI